MTQKKNVLKNEAGDIELKDATIGLNSANELLTVNLKDGYSNFFIESKDVNIHISFTYGQGIKITAYQDSDEKEIKKLEFESVTKNKILKIKLNKLLDGVEIKNRE